MKKIRLSSEFVYILGLLLLSFSVAMIASTDFGVSMIVAPAYILSLKVEALSFGQCEYVIQGVLFLIMCLLLGRIRPIYFSSFVTGLIYGALLDLWRLLIPAFNPAVTAPGTLALPLRILMLAGGLALTSFSIALFFRTYFYPQVYDFFVKAVSRRFGLNRGKFKIAFDFTFLAISCLLSLLLFGRLYGVGIGTVVATAVNGFMISGFGRVLDRFVCISPRFVRLSRYFEI